LRATPYRGLPTRLNSLCVRMTIIPKARVLVTNRRPDCMGQRGDRSDGGGRTRRTWCGEGQAW
jgi:hypothetical protein